MTIKFEIDVEPTAQAIEDIANNLLHFANELQRTANSMRERKDISYAGEAQQAVKNCFANCRTDLLVIRPIRELDRIQREVENHRETVADMTDWSQSGE